MKQGKGNVPSNEHAPVYHAASQCQATSLPLTLHRLHDLRKVCSVEGQRTGVFASQSRRRLCGFPGMKLACCCKYAGLVDFPLVPHRKEDTHPDICQRADSHAVAFPLCAFPLAILARPRLLLGTFPGKLMQCIAQRLETSEALMDRGVLAALPGHGAGSSQSLDASGVSIAAAIIPPFRQQPEGQVLASTRQTFKDLAVGMRQKDACPYTWRSRRVLPIISYIQEHAGEAHSCSVVKPGGGNALSLASPA
jgi:hypothetical protein